MVEEESITDITSIISNIITEVKIERVNSTHIGADRKFRDLVLTIVNTPKEYYEEYRDNYIRFIEEIIKKNFNTVLQDMQHDTLDIRIIFEILLRSYIDEHSKSALNLLLLDHINTNFCFDVTEKDIIKLFENRVSNVTQDSLIHALATLTYQSTEGYGAIDRMKDLNTVDLLIGDLDNSFNSECSTDNPLAMKIKLKISDEEIVEPVYITVSGLVFHLKFLKMSFQELRRIVLKLVGVDNVYQYR